MTAVPSRTRASLLVVCAIVSLLPIGVLRYQRAHGGETAAWRASAAALDHLGDVYVISDSATTPSVALQADRDTVVLASAAPSPEAAAGSPARPDAQDVGLVRVSYAAHDSVLDVRETTDLVVGPSDDQTSVFVDRVVRLTAGSRLQHATEYVRIRGEDSTWGDVRVSVTPDAGHPVTGRGREAPGRWTQTTAVGTVTAPWTAGADAAAGAGWWHRVVTDPFAPGRSITLTQADLLTGARRPLTIAHADDARYPVARFRRADAKPISVDTASADSLVVGRYQVTRGGASPVRVLLTEFALALGIPMETGTKARPATLQDVSRIGTLWRGAAERPRRPRSDDTWMLGPIVATARVASTTGAGHPVATSTREAPWVLWRGSPIPDDARGAGQDVRGDTIRWARDVTAPAGAARDSLLRSEAFLEHDSAAVALLASALPNDPRAASRTSVSRVGQLVRSRIRIRQGPMAFGANRTAVTGQGTVGDAATLTTALLRRHGWPAQLVGGVVINGDYAYLHTWVEVSTGDGWLRLDPARHAEAQVIGDSTDREYLRLARGPMRVAGLVGMAGRFSLLRSRSVRVPGVSMPRRADARDSGSPPLPSTAVVRPMQPVLLDGSGRRGRPTAPSGADGPVRGGGELGPGALDAPADHARPPAVPDSTNGMSASLYSARAGASLVDDRVPPPPSLADSARASPARSVRGHPGGHAGARAVARGDPAAARAGHNPSSHATLTGCDTALALRPSRNNALADEPPQSFST